MLRSLRDFAQVAGFHLDDCIEYFTAPSRSGPRPGRDPRISQVTNVHDRGGCYEQVGSTNGGIAFLFVLVSSCNVQLLETTFSN